MHNLQLTVLYLGKICGQWFFILESFAVFKKNYTLQHSCNYRQNIFWPRKALSVFDQNSLFWPKQALLAHIYSIAGGPGCHRWVFIENIFSKRICYSDTVGNIQKCRRKWLSV